MERLKIELILPFQLFCAGRKGIFIFYHPISKSFSFLFVMQPHHCIKIIISFAFLFNLSILINGKFTTLWYT
jgi:hypothetical protein